MRPSGRRARVFAVVVPAALLLLPIAGCAATSASDVLREETQVMDPARIDSVLRRAPMEADQDLRAETLLESREFSAHLLQFRTGEQRHIHREHDLTFFVIRGEGEIFVNDRRSALTAGGVFHIPRGAPHACRNTGAEPLVAVLIFTPPYDLKDSIPLPRGERSYERSGD